MKTETLIQSVQSIPAPVLARGGHAAMAAWDKSWKPGCVPQWAKKVIRLHAIKNGTWIPGCLIGTSFLKLPLWDHWGSVDRNGIRALITQPYENCDDEAKAFAAEMGWSMVSCTPAPWHPSTIYYEFLPAQEDASPVNQSCQ